MTSGPLIESLARHACAAATAVLLSVSPAGALADAQPWGLRDLMSSLGGRDRAQARFVETKYLKVLETPIEMSGLLIYTAPARLEKRTLTPKEESVTISDDTVTMETAERKRPRRLRLKDYPVLWGFVESMRATLSGDLATLQRFYAVQLNGAAQDWELMLVPRIQAMRAVVVLIRIRGAGNRIRLIEVNEAQGDRSVLQVFEDTP